MYFEGRYYGGKLITGTLEPINLGNFDKNHCISYGLNNIHEGITISSPFNMSKDFKVFAKNTNNEPFLIYAESNEKHGRIIVCGAVTALFEKYFPMGGNHQLVSNCNVWLTGIPQED
jgi:hypothetical protein